MATSQFVKFGGWTAVAALAVALGFVSTARAGDDGYEPMWVGIGSALGVVPGSDEGVIDYRERAKLVLPKTKVLPPPGSANSANPSWPKDPDIAAAKQAKIDSQKAPFQGWGGGSRHLPVVNVTGPVTIGVNAGKAAPVKPCNRFDGTGACGGVNAQGHSFLNNFGFETAKLGSEPDREWLTDPPRGLRAPVGPLPTPTPAPHN